MAVGLSQPENISPVAGIELASHACGIKKNGLDDLLLIRVIDGASCAATFTKNAFCAAPVIIAKKHLAAHTPKALLINSGNANAGTGEQGLKDALQSCAWVADQLECKAEEVLPFSTGVIGESLPMTKLQQGINAAASTMQPDTWLQASHAILTTDTIAKLFTRQFNVDGETVTITGMAKGSGMICPNMATMLSYIATDAKVEQTLLQDILENAVSKSFNAITVDGDTSTNDACVLLATGVSGIGITPKNSEHFVEHLESICIELAQAVVRDGEGATKFVTINVSQAANQEEARNVAYTIAHSPLVKTALTASDPNWGRILAAVGRSEINQLDINKISIYLDDVCIVSNGARDSEYTEEQGQQVMNQEEIGIRVVLERGDAEMTVWTTDLSHEYVTINSEYRT